jgi:hypothetical protein
MGGRASVTGTKGKERVDTHVFQTSNIWVASARQSTTLTPKILLVVDNFELRNATLRFPSLRAHACMAILNERYIKVKCPYLLGSRTIGARQGSGGA